MMIGKTLVFGVLILLIGVPSYAIADISSSMKSLTSHHSDPLQKLAAASAVLGNLSQVLAFATDHEQVAKSSESGSIFREVFPSSQASNLDSMLEYVCEFYSIHRGLDDDDSSSDDSLNWWVDQLYQRAIKGSPQLLTLLNFCPDDTFGDSIKLLRKHLLTLVKRVDRHHGGGYAASLRATRLRELQRYLTVVSRLTYDWSKARPASVGGIFMWLPRVQKRIQDTLRDDEHRVADSSWFENLVAVQMGVSKHFNTTTKNVFRELFLANLSTSEGFLFRTRSTPRRLASALLELSSGNIADTLGIFSTWSHAISKSFPDDPTAEQLFRDELRRTLCPLQRNLFECLLETSPTQASSCGLNIASISQSHIGSWKGNESILNSLLAACEEKDDQLEVSFYLSSIFFQLSEQLLQQVGNNSLVALDFYLRHRFIAHHFSQNFDGNSRPPFLLDLHLQNIASCKPLSDPTFGAQSFDHALGYALQCFSMLSIEKNPSRVSPFQDVDQSFLQPIFSPGPCESFEEVNSMTHYACHRNRVLAWTLARLPTTWHFLSNQASLHPESQALQRYVVHLISLYKESMPTALSTPEADLLNYSSSAAIIEMEPAEALISYVNELVVAFSADFSMVHKLRSFKRVLRGGPEEELSRNAEVDKHVLLEDILAHWLPNDGMWHVFNKFRREQRSCVGCFSDDDDDDDQPASWSQREHETWTLVEYLTNTTDPTFSELAGGDLGALVCLLLDRLLTMRTPSTDVKKMEVFGPLTHGRCLLLLTANRTGSSQAIEAKVQHGREYFAYVNNYAQTGACATLLPKQWSLASILHLGLRSANMQSFVEQVDFAVAHSISGTSFETHLARHIQHLNQESASRTTLTVADEELFEILRLASQDTKMSSVTVSTEDLLEHFIRAQRASSVSMGTDEIDSAKASVQIVSEVLNKAVPEFEARLRGHTNGSLQSDILASVAQTAFISGGNETDDLIQLLGAACARLKLSTNPNHFLPRPVQLLLVVSSFRTPRNVISRALVGQGKSISSFLLLLIETIRLKRIHRHSSFRQLTVNEPLLKRDYATFSPLLQEFGLTVDITSTKNRCPATDIVYSTSQEDAAGWILEKISTDRCNDLPTIRGAIVDEADSDLIDGALSSSKTRLSESLPGYRFLTDLIIAVYVSARKIIGGLEFDSKSGKIMLNLTHVDQLENRTTERRTGLMIFENYTDFQEEMVARSEHHFLRALERSNPEVGLPLSPLNETDLELEDSIFTNRSSDGRDTHDERNEKLREKVFSEFPLPRSALFVAKASIKDWIRSSFQALLQHDEDVTYVRVGDGLRPVIKTSGIVHTNMRYEKALQQILELHKNLRMEPISLVTNFRSTVALFQSYKRIVGMSGTIGGPDDRGFLNNTFQMSSLLIPPHQQSKLRVYPPLHVPIAHHFAQALDDVFRTVSFSGRAGFIQLASVKACRAAQVELRTRMRIASADILSYCVSHREADLKSASHTLKPGQFFVTTSFGGRGLDLSIDPEVAEAGGLHAVITDLIGNGERFLWQLFGRPARNGLPGSARLVLSVSKDEKPTLSYPALLKPALSTYSQSLSSCAKNLDRDLLRFDRTFKFFAESRLTSQLSETKKLQEREWFGQWLLSNPNPTNATANFTSFRDQSNPPRNVWLQETQMSYQSFLKETRPIDQAFAFLPLFHECRRRISVVSAVDQSHLATRDAALRICKEALQRFLISRERFAISKQLAAAVSQNHTADLNQGMVEVLTIYAAYLRAAINQTKDCCGHREKLQTKEGLSWWEVHAKVQNITEATERELSTLLKELGFGGVSTFEVQKVFVPPPPKKKRKGFWGKIRAALVAIVNAVVGAFFVAVGLVQIGVAMIQSAVRGLLEVIWTMVTGAEFDFKSWFKSQIMRNLMAIVQVGIQWVGEQLRAAIGLSATTSGLAKEAIKVESFADVGKVVTDVGKDVITGFAAEKLTKFALQDIHGKWSEIARKVASSVASSSVSDSRGSIEILNVRDFYLAESYYQTATPEESRGRVSADDVSRSATSYLWQEVAASSKRSGAKNKIKSIMDPLVSTIEAALLETDFWSHAMIGKAIIDLKKIASGLANDVRRRWQRESDTLLGIQHLMCDRLSRELSIEQNQSVGFVENCTAHPAAGVTIWERARKGTESFAAQFAETQGRESSNLDSPSWRALSEVAHGKSDAGLHFVEAQLREALCDVLNDHFDQKILSPIKSKYLDPIADEFLKKAWSKFADGPRAGETPEDEQGKGRKRHEEKDASEGDEGSGHKDLGSDPSQQRKEDSARTGKNDGAPGHKCEKPSATFVTKEEDLAAILAEGAYTLSPTSAGEFSHGKDSEARFKAFARAKQRDVPELKGLVYITGSQDFAFFRLPNYDPPGIIRLIVRGTEFKASINLLRDLSNDLGPLKHLAMSYSRPDYAIREFVKMTRDLPNGHGFLKYFDMSYSRRFETLDPAFQEVVKMNPGAKFRITGHSLGGAQTIALGVRYPSLVEQARGFNCFGLAPDPPMKGFKGNNIFVHHVTGDFLSHFFMKTLKYGQKFIQKSKISGWDGPHKHENFWSHIGETLERKID